ncbi:Fic/DOC family N-terminal domain-containing protein [Candidatus Neptunochlamydia vexilliferae]|uniref:Adenosine monophosphate-protein transferase n=1 Tax=Candidatus Neptunichlamydia vexilliferae TaxID=1651774 RepID=A0ABS0AZI3_9BACT|nr:Adenosine monophosphate-protein transferase [Candidatus Neptunochlamydia vexilliferae]
MEIKNSPTGKIIKCQKGYRAFVPNPLTTDMEWDNRVMMSLSRADFLLGKLAREGSKLGNPHLLIHPFVTREAVLSSRIEGTQATVGEVLAADAGMKIKQNPDDLKEVQNYIIALEYGLKRLEKIPLSLRLIKEIHHHLMQGVRGFHATPGEFRKSQNWIGIAGCTLNTAKFVPPPPDHLLDCLGELEKFLHERELPPLIHAALCQYQFEAIHPFLDGNGRVGRLLIILLLIEQSILPSPLLYLSAFFEATRDEYYRQLYSLSSQGTWQDWLVYFLNGVALQSEDALSRTERINALLDKWKVKMAVGGSQASIDVVENFAVNPYVTAKKIAAELEVAYSTAQRVISRLETAKIIQQVGEGKRDKIYCATKILSILEEPAKVRANVSY